MKTIKKALLIVLCLALLVTASVVGTVAYLTSQDSVENTFTVGQVNITLDETKVDQYGVAVKDADPVDTNEYKLIPGREYTKDPTIHVAEGSEECWLFSKIENGLGDNADISFSEGWAKLDGTDDIWYYSQKVDAREEVKNITIFKSFTYADTVTDTTEDAEKTIKVTAYAIQADGMDTYTDAAKALNLITTTNP